MDLSSSLAGTKEFRIVKRGYDPDEVDAFLDQIALGVSELKRKLAEAGEQAPATPVAPGPRAEADEIQRALILAQRAADEEVRKAAAEGEAVVAEARDRAAELLREADRDVAERREQGRSALLAEIAGLEAQRDSLAGDVGVLERHVDEQREVVQAAVGELQSLLDHPEAFRVAPAGSGAAPAPTAVPSAPAPPPATAEADGDDDEEGDAAALPGEQAEDDEDHQDGPLPGLDDLARALNAEDEDDEAEPGWGDPERAGADQGPPTEALDPVPDDGEDDAFLAELRKAMLDDEPLGPRDAALLPGPRGEDVPTRPRARFGRRR